MRLNRECACCHRPMTTKNTVSLGITDDFGGMRILWINCRVCQSTQTFYRKPTAAELARIMNDVGNALLKGAA